MLRFSRTENLPSASVSTQWLTHKPQLRWAFFDYRERTRTITRTIRLSRISYVGDISPFC
jgi:hypothetical protein